MTLRTLNGTTLEGGGQLVRLSICLSAITARPIQITHIRGNRSGGGGLKEQHLCCIQWLANACDAKVEGMEKKSQGLYFWPRERSDGWWEHATIEKDGYQLPVRTARVQLATAGAVTLVLQAILPFILFAGSEDSPLSAPANGSCSKLEEETQRMSLGASQSVNSSPSPILLTLNGGTNVSNSPSIDYVLQVLLPNCHLLGLPLIELLNDQRDIDKRFGRCWTTGKFSLGTASLLIHPLPRNSTLQALRCPPRGDVGKFTITILAPQDLRFYIQSQCMDIIQRLVCSRNLFKRTLISGEKAVPLVEILTNEDSGHPKRLHLLIVAHTDSGFRLGSDCLLTERIGTTLQARQKTADRLVERAVAGLERELSSGRCLDGWMEDQVVVFQALAQGRSRITPEESLTREDEREEPGNEKVKSGRGGDNNQARSVKEASLHTRTVRWVANEILGVEFDEDGECEGVGYAVGRGIPND